MMRSVSAIDSHFSSLLPSPPPKPDFSNRIRLKGQYSELKGKFQQAKDMLDALEAELSRNEGKESRLRLECDLIVEQIELIQTRLPESHRVQSEVPPELKRLMRFRDQGPGIGFLYESDDQLPTEAEAEAEGEEEEEEEDADAEAEIVGDEDEGVGADADIEENRVAGLVPPATEQVQLNANPQSMDDVGDEDAEGEEGPQDDEEAEEEEEEEDEDDQGDEDGEGEDEDESTAADHHLTDLGDSRPVYCLPASSPTPRHIVQ